MIFGFFCVYFFCISLDEFNFLFKLRIPSVYINICLGSHESFYSLLIVKSVILLQLWQTFYYINTRSICPSRFAILPSCPPGFVFLLRTLLLFWCARLYMDVVFLFCNFQYTFFVLYVQCSDYNVTSWASFIFSPGVLKASCA